ncbi:Inner centromere protein ARK binding region [Trichostrongylus colubriformis]|uniref:Inner centromere protein ARK binding region n=1 Tax=Trichostrongylus colubriformis TaxID=6319 RepID=A0AAN8FWJ7_TRICO
MPPKRSRKKPSTAKVNRCQQENGQAHADEGSSDSHDADHEILLHPTLQLRRIAERGCSATMVDLQATFSDASEWLHAQKATLKNFFKEAGGKTVPKTPRRGATFMRIRETVEDYSRSISLFEDSDDDVRLEHKGQGDVAPANMDAQLEDHIRTPMAASKEQYTTEQKETIAETVSPTVQDEMEAEPESVYEDAVCSMNRDEANTSERIDEQQRAEIRPPDGQWQTAGDGLTDVEGSSHNDRTDGHTHHAPAIKVEVESPAVSSPMAPVCSQPSTTDTPVTNVSVKREILSFQRIWPNIDAPITTPISTCERVTRSVARANAAMNVVSLASTKARIIASVKNRKQTPVSAARAVEEGELDRPSAGPSQTRVPRAVHQHIVTTPCKREYKSAVQRVMDGQAVARTLSPKRQMVHTPSRPTRAANTETMTAATANPSLRAEKKKAEALRREKEELAAQLREEQCRERAERIRKEREEKALRAQRRREQKEAEERQKAEARKRKEELDERRREEIRVQKSPSRSKAPSRVASPARVNKATTSNDVRPAAKVLFPTTPGRAPTKVAKMTAASGEASREPTMNTPTREVRRKPCTGNKDSVKSNDTTDDDTVSPPTTESKHRIAREELQRVMREEHERQERLREEKDARRRLRLDGRERQVTSGHANVKMEVDEVKNDVVDEVQNYEAEQRLIFEEHERKRLLEEEERRKRFVEEEKERERLRIEEELRKREEEAFQKEQEQEKQKLMAMQQKEAQKLLEQQAERAFEEKQMLLKSVEEERLNRLRIEEEEALTRLNISSSAELHNRHLENVSFNTPAVHQQSASRHNSYELTPDKVFKPSDENNYNIEDLSSGDETDEEDAPRKKVPLWADGNLLRRAQEEQAALLRSGRFNPDQFFGEIFPVLNYPVS